ncbi:hypothetical protein [Rhizohabitans arisaemae]|uniref:hypothetical protein n=1 Tax=Rhizohabitans arisaemae TaxID=2720610 RepID=UPI0024B1C7F9|nr:hypothetical protein [Rhizohabitans arisaemae]
MTITKRTVGAWAVCVGLFLPVIAFMVTSGTYLPYQDPTPEISKKYAEEVAYANLVNLVALSVGALLVGVGAALLVYARTKRRPANIDE